MDNNHLNDINSETFLFSTDKKDYKGLYFIDLQIDPNKILKLSEKASIINMGFHIPIVKEKDNFHYALWLEADMVTYGSNQKNAINRMTNHILYILEEGIKNENLHSYFEQTMEGIYFQIFHELKQQYLIKQAKILTNSNHKINRELEVNVIKELQTKKTLESSEQTVAKIIRKYHIDLAA